MAATPHSSTRSIFCETIHQAALLRGNTPFERKMTIFVLGRQAPQHYMTLITLQSLPPADNERFRLSPTGHLLQYRMVADSRS